MQQSHKIVEAACAVLIESLGISENKAYLILDSAGDQVLAFCQFIIQRGVEGIKDAET